MSSKSGPDLLFVVDVLYALYLDMFHNDVMTWKRSRITGPFVRESTGHRWIPLTKGQ